MVNIYIFPLLSAFALSAVAFPQYGSLAGLSEREIEEATASFATIASDPLPTPTPVADSTSKLVNNASHPFIAPGPGDLRGPCPGLYVLLFLVSSTLIISDPLLDHLGIHSRITECVVLLLD